MDSISIIDSAYSILSENEKLRLRFQNELKWLIDKKSHWNLDKIRIGVIGVTSSGKSTLINAILGVGLLSTAVRPSSSQLVSCCFGETNSAKVFFNDGRVELFSGNSLTPLLIKSFSDEEYNSKNTKGVKQLELSTPYFDLGEDTLLIDSPGLDAYNLDIHEKLTLETLVPTVDLCVYVTTFKSNSDEKTKAFLNIVSKYNCMVVIVQNMLDSVKAGLDGKSIEQVVLGHKNRMKRIVSQSNINDKDSVRILHISAQQAKQFRCEKDENRKNSLKGVYEASCYEQFRNAIRAAVEQQKPEMENKRISNILDKLSAILKQEEMFISNDDSSNLVFKLEGVAETLMGKFEADNDKLIVLIESFNIDKIAKTKNEKQKTPRNGVGVVFSLFNDLFQTPDGLPSDKLKRVDKITKKVKEKEEEICEIIVKFNKYLIEMIEKAGMLSRDVISFNGLPNVPALEVKNKIEHYSVQVEKSGVGGKVGRLFGGLFDKDWGYEYVDRTRQVIDDNATEQTIIEHLNRIQTIYGRTVETWHEKTHASIANILYAIEQELESFNTRKQEAMDAKELKAIFLKISQLIEPFSIEKTEKNKIENVVDTFTILKPIEVKQSVVDIYKIADKCSDIIHNNALYFYLKSVEMEKNTNMIISWDKTCLTNFQKKFFALDGEEPLMLMNPATADMENLFNLNSQLNVFILTNAIQIGSATKQIDECGIIELLRVNDFVSFVIQDFNEIINADEIENSIQNIFLLKTEFQLRNKCAIVINHENPIYNMAILEKQLGNTTNISDETKLLNNLQTKFHYLLNVEVVNNISEIIRLNI